MVTVGCQEAMILVLRGAVRRPRRRAARRRALLRRAHRRGPAAGHRRCVPVPEARTGSTWPTGRRRSRRARARRAAAPRRCTWCRTSPTRPGSALDLADRHAAARRRRRGGPADAGGQPVRPVRPRRRAAGPTLKALDTDRRVIYLGSFAKSVLPRRAGRLPGRRPAGGRRRPAGAPCSPTSCRRSRAWSRSTPRPIAQAVVGGMLLESGCSLRGRQPGEDRLLPAEPARLLGAPGPALPGDARAGALERARPAGSSRWSTCRSPRRRGAAGALRRASTGCCGPR